MRVTKRSIVRFLKKNIYYVFNFINKILKKNDMKIFIYDGPFNKSNCWALLEYLINNKYCEKYYVIYYTNERRYIEKYNNLNNVKFESNFIRGFFSQITSKYVFWEQGWYKFTCQPAKGQVVMNLWHGMPLKSIGYIKGDKPIHPYSNDFTYILVTSNFFSSIMKNAFGHKASQEYIGGYPRNDYLKKNSAVYSILIGDFHRESSNILWMPTYRKSSSHNFNESDIEFPILDESNIREFDDFLNRNNINLIIKPHPVQNSLSIFEKNYNRIQVITTEMLLEHDIELYELVGQSDMLLTDYSSVYFDYLLTQKPIGFVLDDFEEYAENRGFAMENPKAIMPGEFASNLKELQIMLTKFVHGIDEYKEQRKEINELVNYRKENHSKNILDFLGITI